MIMVDVALGRSVASYSLLKAISVRRRIEVLPTDQIAAVQVSYDPKTGLQL
jgi:hypothetical protein